MICYCYRSGRSADAGSFSRCWSSAVGQDECRGGAGWQRDAWVRSESSRLLRRRAPDSHAVIVRSPSSPHRRQVVDNRRQQHREVAFHRSSSLRSGDDDRRSSGSRTAPTDRQVPLPHPHPGCMSASATNDINELVAWDFWTTEGYTVKITSVRFAWYDWWRLHLFCYRVYYTIEEICMYARVCNWYNYSYVH